MILLFLLLIVSCKPALPPDVLTESELESVLYDFHIAQGIVETQPSVGGYQNMEARRYELHQAVFRKHGITQAQFDTTMVFYCSDLERLNRVYRHLAIRMEREAEALGAATASPDTYARLSAEGDTANVWAGKLIFALRNRLQENLQTWQQPCDSTWLPGDDILWRFSPSLYAKAESYYFFATIVVTYTNDSIRARTQTGTSRSVSEIRINDKEGWTPRSISGYFYMPVENDPQLSKLIIISNPSLIRFHKSEAWRNEKAGKGLVADSLSNDSTAGTPAAAPVPQDSAIHKPTPSDHRLSPSEFREQQPVDRKIEIVKEKPYQVRKRNKKNRR